MPIKVFIVVACHFVSPNVFCTTTAKRLDAALREYWKLRAGDPHAQAVFIVTGNVPYKKGGRTLAELMRQYLTVPASPDLDPDLGGKILVGEGVGIFSEARTITKYVKRRFQNASITVFSSDWYFWPAAAIWKRFAEKRKLPLEFFAVYGTGGWRTKLFYLIYAAIVKTAESFLLGRQVENLLTKMQSSRKEGFTFDGCR